MRRILTALLALAAAAPGLLAQQGQKLEPTAAAVPYGKHERQVIDFYQAKSDAPTPLVLYIHGGGWQGGDKNTYGAANIKYFLDHGISVAAINYRYVKQAAADGVEPPVKAPLEDAARALQFIRSKAKEWNLDRKRVGATGGSAGGCSSLWLAFHDDLADPKSDDPVARESTRLYCAAVNGAQTTLDPVILREWMPNYGYGAHAFNLKNFQDLYENRAKVKDWIAEYSPMAHVSKDDPPVGLYYGGEEPVKGGKPKDPTHSALLGVMLQARLNDAGVESVLVYPGHASREYPDARAFLLEHLKK